MEWIAPGPSIPPTCLVVTCWATAKPSTMNTWMAAEAIGAKREPSNAIPRIRLSGHEREATSKYGGKSTYMKDKMDIYVLYTT